MAVNDKYQPLQILKETHEKLKEIAQKEGRTMSGLIKILVDNHYIEHGYNKNDKDLNKLEID